VLPFISLHQATPHTQPSHFIPAGESSVHTCGRKIHIAGSSTPAALYFCTCSLSLSRSALQTRTNPCIIHTHRFFGRKKRARAAFFSLSTLCPWRAFNARMRRRRFRKWKRQSFLCFAFFCLHFHFLLCFSSQSFVSCAAFLFDGNVFKYNPFDGRTSNHYRTAYAFVSKSISTVTNKNTDFDAANTLYYYAKISYCFKRFLSDTNKMARPKTLNCPRIFN